MNYKIEVTAYFSKQLKRLSKRYPSLKIEYAALVSSLKVTPNQGFKIGNNCYKVRLSIASKGKSKSGGARVITHLQIIESKVFLLSIYDKSEQNNINDKDLDIWINDL